MALSLPVILTFLKNKLKLYYTKTEIDTLVSNAISKVIIWKPVVTRGAFASDILALEGTYPSAEEGWTASIAESNKVYRFDVDTSTWIEIDASSIPLASDTLDGKMSSGDYTKLFALPTAANLQLALDGKEKKFDTPTENQMILSGNTDGSRYWTAKPRAGHAIQKDLVSVPDRTYLNFVGEFITISDDPVSPDTTTISLASVKGSTIVKDVTQANHGFIVGNWVYRTLGIYVLGNADSPATSDIVGMVTSVKDANNFTLTSSGYVTGLSGLIDGDTYFLSDVVSGNMENVAPITVGHVNKPIFVADSATSGYVINYRGIIIVAPTQVVDYSSQLNLKADKATTLAGYGITDAYTKTESDARYPVIDDTQTSGSTNKVWSSQYTLSRIPVIDDSLTAGSTTKLWSSQYTLSRIPAIDDSLVNGSTTKIWSSQYTLSRINSPTLAGYKESVSALGNITGAINLNLNTANVFTATLTGNVTLSFTVTSGSLAYNCTLILTNDGTSGRTVSLPAGTKTVGGVALSRTTAASATDIWLFYTWNGGVTWVASISHKDVK